MRTLKLSEESYQTLLWLLSAYLCGDVEESESYDSGDDTYASVQQLQIEVNRA